MSALVGTQIVSSHAQAQFILHRNSTAFGSAHFGQGSGNILLDDMACIGNEADISQCGNRGGWGSHNCAHTEDAGVKCQGKF